MSRRIVVSHGGEVSSFDFTRITREKIYGTKKRLIVDDEGEGCITAMLTRDGSALLPPGTTGYLYITEDNEVVDRAELKAVDEEGQLVPEAPSTLGVEQALACVDAERVLDHVVTAVYELEDHEVGASLTEKLAAGEIFELRFNYRKGFEDFPAFLLKNDGGIFCLVCEEARLEMLFRDATALEPEDEDDVDPFEDDLDFSMF